MYLTIAFILWVAIVAFGLRWIKSCVKEGSTPPDIESLFMGLMISVLLAGAWIVMLPIAGAYFGSHFVYHRVFLPWVQK